MRFIFTLFFSAAMLFNGSSALQAAEKPARPATVLLITSSKLADAWKPFAQWKTELGKATKIITVDAIKKNYKGKDVQDKIRACCLAHINKHGTRWVVLGGDSQPNGGGHVPDRDTHHREFYKYQDIPTDIYYLSEKNWDANGDGVYGQWSKDKAAISYINPKASVGRIPVRTVADVKAYTAKVIAYESKYPSKNFAQQMVYTCPMKMACPKLETSKKVLAPLWKTGKLLQFFAHKTPWDKNKPGDHNLTPANWISLINKKQTSKMHVHGHGLWHLWVLEGHQTVTKNHVAKLKNDHAYLAMTTVSCFTGQYDSLNDPSITESMLRAPNGGAVIIIAPSREGIPIFHKRSDMQLMITQGKMDGTTTTMTRFWKHALSKNLTAGEALRAAKQEMVADAKKTKGFHFLQCELNLLGDPTLDLRSKDPITPKVTVQKTVASRKSISPEKGSQLVIVKTNTPNAVVCLCKGDEFYLVAKTDANGTVKCSVDIPTPGKLLVTVSGSSLNVVQKTIEVK